MPLRARGNKQHVHGDQQRMSGGLMRPRLGSIEFVNSLPVDWGFLSGAVPVEANIVTGSPAFLNDRISARELEVSPISVFWYAQRQKEFLLFPDLSISSESSVDSVLL